MKKQFTKTGMFVIAFVIANLFLMNGAFGQLGTGVVSVSSVSGSCVQFVPANGGGPDNYRIAPGSTYTMTITGVTECSGNFLTVFAQNSGSTNFCFNVYNGGSGNTYAGQFTVPVGNCLTSPLSYKCGENQPCTNANTFNAQGPTPGHTVHLDSWTWGADCTPIAQKSCGEICIPPTITSCNGGGSLGCNPSLPPLAVQPTWTGGGTATYSDATTNTGCSYTLTRTWTINNGCTPNASCEQVYTYTQAGALVFDNLPTGSYLGCNPQTHPACASVTAHNECGTVNASCTTNGPASTVDCRWSQTFHYHAEANCGSNADADVTYTWKEDHTGPNVTNNPPTAIQSPCTTTFNGLPWQAPTWGDNCSGNITVTDVISPNQQQTTCPATYTRTWTATDACGNPSTFTQSITVACCTVCTYTQGYYGNAGGLSCNGTNGNLTTAQQITNAINHWGGTLTIGLTGKSVIITNSTAGYVNCVIGALPGGGPGKELSSGNANICSLPSGYLKNGRINNVLLSQTITLGLNMGIMTTQNLSGFVLQGGSLATAAVVGGCGGNVPVARVCLYDQVTHLLTGVQNEYKYFTIKQAVVNALGTNPANRTVGALFNLANRALANQDGITGTENGVSLSDIADAEDAINNAFDGCRIPVGFNVPPCSPSNNAPVTQKGGSSNLATTSAALAISSTKPDEEISNVLSVKAYPNPYTDEVKFLIGSPVTGKGTLKIYNMLGQKLQTIDMGYIFAGIKQEVEYKVPDAIRTNLFYTLTVGDKTINGTLINVKPK